MKVFIIGIRKQHLDKLKEKFPSISFDGLTDSDDHAKRKKNVLSSDLIIVLSKFTNHTSMWNYRHHHNFKLISGGYSSIFPILKDFINV